MQHDQHFQPVPVVDGSRELSLLRIHSEAIPIEYIRNLRARRYILRVTAAGIARVTLPRWGSKAQAHLFAQREVCWIDRQLQKRRAEALRAQPWTEGTTFLFRGEHARIQIDKERKCACFADQRIPLPPDCSLHLREIIESRLRELALLELVPRTSELAQLHALAVRRVVIRNQKSRWGSCSVRGTVSLNWRLIQTPSQVVEYIIIHELMHLREMNHSPRFWRHVAAAFPDYRLAERWLRQNSRLLR